MESHRDRADAARRTTTTNIIVIIVTQIDKLYSEHTACIQLCTVRVYIVYVLASLSFTLIILLRYNYFTSCLE